jgi:hypothetical protein
VVSDFGGPVATWLVDHLPELAPAATRRAGGEPPDAEPAVPAELRAAFAGPPAELATLMVSGLVAGRYRWAHRAVLLNAVATMPRASLPTLLAALRDGRDGQERLSHDGADLAAPLGLWTSLIELADVRHSMLLELEPADARP